MTERPTLSLLFFHCIALQYLVIIHNGKEYENEKEIKHIPGKESKIPPLVGRSVK